ncbi:MAG: alkaline phosphatase family protein [Demequinaceae bacterium]|nr:alkaline phosphatase family protein [Demequinaceae bacterium]
MTLAERVDRAGFVLPDYGGRELGAVISAALSAVGGADIVQGRDAAADQGHLNVPDARHVCVALLDGLGELNLDARRGHAPFLRSLGGVVATAGYPSTTAASLSLLGTGRTSGETGMAGYTVRNPKTGKLANLISWEGAEPAEEWQVQPSLLEEASLAGIRVTTLGRARFAGSGLTHAVLRGGQFIGAERLADRVDVALGSMKDSGISYMYWGEIDGVGHAYGWQSEMWTASLEDADRELARLASSMPKGTVLLVTADHGMIDVTGAPRWDLAKDPSLDEGVDFLAGEPRALHVYTRDPEGVAARWQETLGDNAVVAVQDDAIGLGIFGPVLPAVRGGIGDVVVAMTGRATVVDSRVQSEASMGLIGVHGSLTPNEMLIPVLVAV